MLPIHIRHIFCPEVIPLKPPRLPIHLMPFSRRNDGGFDTTQVNPTRLSTRSSPTPRLGIAFSLFACLDNAQPISSGIDKRFRITRKLKIINAGDQPLLFLLFEVVGMEHTSRSAVLIIVWGCILDRKRRKKCFAFNTSDLPITSVRIREGDDALRDTFQIYRDAFLRLLLRFLIRCLILVILSRLSFIFLLFLLLKRTRFRDERMAQGFL